MELAWSAVISVVIIGLGAYYLAREIAQRRRQGDNSNLPAADRRHFQWQFYRRVTGSSLLVAAGLAIFVGQGLLDWTASPLLYFSIWLGILLGLFGIVCLAGADIVGIQRYARRQQRKLQADRREMIARQLDAYQAERGGTYRPDDFDVERN
jgi:hypothetical protein